MNISYRYKTSPMCVRGRDLTFIPRIKLTFFKNGRVQENHMDLSGMQHEVKEFF